MSTWGYDALGNAAINERERQVTGYRRAREVRAVSETRIEATSSPTSGLCLSWVWRLRRVLTASSPTDQS
jgi:hypothetical protein